MADEMDENKTKPELQVNTEEEKEQKVIEVEQEDAAAEDDGRRNTRIVKHQRFDQLVNSLNISCREMNKSISVRGGLQNFKWLAFTSKFWYSKHHKFKDHPDKYVVVDVRNERTNDNLMPGQIIKDRVNDKDTVSVTLATKFQPDPMKKPEKKSPTDGEEEDDILAALEEDDEEEKKAPVVKYWSNLDGWLEPQVMEIKEKKFTFKAESRVLVPPGSELQFYFVVDGEKHLAKNYKKKKVLIGRKNVHVNYYELKPYLPTLGDEKPKEESGKFSFPFDMWFQQSVRIGIPFENNDIEGSFITTSLAKEEEEEEEEELEEEKEPEIPPFLYQLVQPPSAEESEECFEADWKEMQILDVVRKPEERKKIRAMIKDNFEELRAIFQRLAGKELPVEYMGANDFLAFCKETGFFRHGFTVTFVPIVFKRVNIMEIQSEENRGKGFVLYEDPTNPEHLFTRSEWIESMVRIANYYNLSKTMSEKFKKVLDLCLKKHTRIVKDDKTREFMKKESTKKVYGPYLERVYSIFERFAHMDKTMGSSRYMQIEEYWNFISTMAIGTLGIIRRNINQALAYSQARSLEDDRGYITDYPEYLELLARLAFACHPEDSKEEALKKFLDYIIEKAVKLEMIEELEEDDD
eukprot:jgi/Bigna1/137837/aug1.41_g12545